MPIRKRAPIARIMRHGGTPTLTLDGKPVSAMAYVGDIPDYCENIGKTGVNISSIVTRAHYGFFPDPPHSTASVDYLAQHDAIVREMVRVWPDVMFFPRLQCEAPTWWQYLYPDEAAHHEMGDGLAVRRHPRKHGIPSWASDVWRAHTIEALKRYIDYVKASDFGHRFIGYHLASGTSAEWMAFGGNSGYFLDYSKPGIRKWREWLGQRYLFNEAALQRAWQMEGVTFDTAWVPPYRDRVAHDGQWLLDPKQSQPLIDYHHFYADMTVETISLLAQEVKEHTQHEAFVGVFYGYVLQLCNEQRQQNAGHMALRIMLECPYIDFLSSPSHYGDRRIDTGYSSFMSLTESVRQHGKLWYNENDFMSPLGHRGAEDSCADEVSEYVEIQKACYASVVCKGVTQWFLGFNDGWYDHPDILALIKRQREIDVEALSWDRTSTNQVAIIVDDQSQMYQPVSNVIPHFHRDSASRWLIYDLPPRVGHSGVGVDWVLLDDLDQTRPYKVYFVLNAFALDERKRELLRLRVCGQGATVLWMYAPGVIGETLDASGVSALTGMEVRMSREAAPMSIDLSRNARHPLLENTMAGVTRLGHLLDMAPRFWIDEGKATVLGRCPCDGRTTLAVRTFADWRSIYLSVPLTLDERFIREVARWGGAHVYHEGADPTYIGPNLIALHAETAGTKRINLPYRARVRELYSNRKIANATSVIQEKFERYETKLYRFEGVA